MMSPENTSLPPENPPPATAQSPVRPETPPPVQPMNAPSYTQPENLGQPFPRPNTSQFAPYSGYAHSVTPPAPPRPVTRAEIWLLAIALGLAVALDRLANAAFTAEDGSLPVFMGVFWLFYLAVLYTARRKTLCRRPLLWFVAGCAALLCVWCFLFDSGSEYGALTLPVVPALLAGHAVLASDTVDLKRIALLVKRYMAACFTAPFSALPRLFETIEALARKLKLRKISMALLGVAAALPLLAIVIPLLAGADKMFAQAIESVFRGFSFSEFFGHTGLILLIAALAFSFLWNHFHADAKPEPQRARKNADVTFSAAALGLVLCVYLLFDGFQFAYLFARTGLPEGLSYSDYAVTGFWQLVAAASINLTLYGIFLHYTPKSAVVRTQLLALLGLTGVMMASAFVRLTLYVERFGMTWLRLLSYWFMCFLAAALILCAVRMFREKMPLMAICALLLAGWFVVFGFADPTRIITEHNRLHGVTDVPAGIAYWIDAPNVT